MTVEFDMGTAVERELVLRSAGLLWRLRRATAIKAVYCRSSLRRS